MRLKRETQGAFCVLNANTNAKSQTRKSMKINVICTVAHAHYSAIFLKLCEGRALTGGLSVLIHRYLHDGETLTGGLSVLIHRYLHAGETLTGGLSVLINRGTLSPNTPGDSQS